MEPASREDVADLRLSVERLAREVSALVGIVREEIGRCAACRPVVDELQHYVQVDCKIRDNGSAGSLDTVVRSHEKAIDIARRSLRWAMSAIFVWLGTAITAAVTWIWQSL